MRLSKFVIAAALTAAFSTLGNAKDLGDLAVPAMDAVNGKALFVEKGCVACHSVNGIGGEIGPRLDSRFTLRNATNLFDFGARMWTHAESMIEVQKATIGGQIDLTGQELANITAFAYDENAQKTFSESDISDEVKRLIKIANGY